MADARALPPLDAREFDRAFAALRASYEGAAENPQGFELKNCRYCSSCIRG